MSSTSHRGLEAALDQLDVAKLVDDVQSVIRIPSVTGGEADVLKHLEERARVLGLTTELVEENLGTLCNHPDFPGNEASRSALFNLTATPPLAHHRRPRLCINGHVDVVGPGTHDWRHEPWSGAVENGFIYGRGSVDMKGSLVAALHALGAIKRSGSTPAWELVLQAVSSEEDGGSGSFALLQRDAHFDACLSVEPTDLKLVCAQAGALTFAGTVPGRSAHGAFRLEGCSAIDRYVRIHHALAELEKELNRDVTHPLMRQLALPYPLSVGQLQAGCWSSQVPDRLTFEGRLGVPLGQSLDGARARLEEVVRFASDDGEQAVEIEWTGGQFAPAETEVSDPFVQVVSRCLGAELGATPQLAGIAYGADMRLFVGHGIPTVMVGPRDIRLAHAVDERVLIDDLVTVARTVIRVAFAELC